MKYKSIFPQKEETMEPAQVERTMLRKLILGGNSAFTLKNAANGTRKTYSVKKHKEKDLFFVSVRGDEDKLHTVKVKKNWIYIGTIFESNAGKGKFSKTRKTKVNINSKSFKGFSWLWQKVVNNDELPAGIEVYHTGYCCKCGRELTDPESVQKGFGPTCYKSLG